MQSLAVWRLFVCDTSYFNDGLQQVKNRFLCACVFIFIKLIATGNGVANYSGKKLLNAYRDHLGPKMPLNITCQNQMWLNPL